MKVNALVHHFVSTMCIVFVSQNLSGYRYIILNNRDEDLERETALAHHWKKPDGSDGCIFGGLHSCPFESTHVQDVIWCVAELGLL